MVKGGREMPSDTCLIWRSQTYIIIGRVLQCTNLFIFVQLIYQTKPNKCPIKYTPRKAGWYVTPCMGYFCICQKYLSQRKCLRRQGFHPSAMPIREALADDSFPTSPSVAIESCLFYLSIGHDVRGQPDFSSSISQSQVNQVHYFWQELHWLIQV